MAPHLGSVSKAYAIGRQAAEVALELNELAGKPICEVCETMAQAVGRAGAEAASGETVLLAPAAASFDQYDNFEQRGDDFVAEVARLLSADGT